MSLFEDTNPRALKDLLSEINSRTTVLPDFQRDFVWDPAATPRTDCLGAAGGARDFHTQAVITGNLMNQEGIDDHHIFPADYLEKQGVKESRVRDCVLNRTLIDRTTNQMISNRAPSRYLTDIKKTPNFPFDNVLNSHPLPTGEQSPLFRDDFEGFLQWRQDRLGQEIRRVTGAADPNDPKAKAAKV